MNARRQHVSERSLLETERVTHVLIDDDRVVRSDWAPAVNTREMVAWLQRDNRLTEIPLHASHQRLFTTGARPPVDERVFQTTAVPAAMPLIQVGTTLYGQVGLDPGFLTTPWPVERANEIERGFLWIGQGRAEGLQFVVWSREAQPVDVQFTVTDGPSLTTHQRTVALLADGAIVGEEQVFHDRAALAFRVDLHDGRNELTFFALDTATVPRMPNGDERHLIVALHDVTIARRAGAVDQRPTDDLAQDAKRAAGWLAGRQRPPGTWLTTYTSGLTYEQPGEELNTFTAVGHHRRARTGGRRQRARGNRAGRAAVFDDSNRIGRARPLSRSPGDPDDRHAWLRHHARRR